MKVKKLFFNESIFFLNIIFLKIISKQNISKNNKFCMFLFINFKINYQYLFNYREKHSKTQRHLMGN